MIQAVYKIDPRQNYGIAIDCKQRIWLGSWSEDDIGNNESNNVGNIKRYDPFAPEDNRLAIVDNTFGVHSITTDILGNIWGSYEGGEEVNANLGKVYKIDAEDLTVKTLDVPTKGIAVDRDGMIWSIPVDSNKLHVINPHENDQIENNVVTLPGLADTYSDMTGEQLLLASYEPGFYIHTLAGCDNRPTGWGAFHWKTEMPEGTHISFSIRIDDNLEALEEKHWIPFINIVSENESGSKSLDDLLSGYPGHPRLYIQLRAVLYEKPEVDINDFKGCIKKIKVNPQIKWFGISYYCYASDP